MLLSQGAPLPVIDAVLPAACDQWTLVFAGQAESTAVSEQNQLRQLGFNVLDADAVTTVAQACQSSHSILIAPLAWFTTQAADLAPLPPADPGLPCRHLRVALANTKELPSILARPDLGIGLIHPPAIDLQQLLSDLAGLAWMPRQAYRVLLIDDISERSRPFAASLASAGFLTQTASGADALTALDDFAPDVCLLTSPECSDLVTLLRQAAPHSGLPILPLLPNQPPAQLVSLLASQARHYRSQSGASEVGRQSLEQQVSQHTSQLEATLEATDNGILVVDRAGQIRLWNSRFIEMWKVPADLQRCSDDQQLLQHVLAQLVAPEDFLRKVQRLYQKPEMSSRDTLRCLDGRVFARFSHPQRIGDAIVGRVWSFLDITDQYQAEQRILQLSSAITTELENSERQRGELQALLSAIPDLVWMKDAAGVYLSCNPALGELLGVSPTQIVGKRDADFFPPEAVSQFRADDQLAASSASPITCENWVTNLTDGQRRLLESIKTAVRSKDGRLIGVLGIARDITRARALLDELDEARSAAQQASAAKSSFLAHMSHEIRTPMNAIIGMADLCLKTPLNTRQRNYVSKIKSASETLLHIINDILDFSKIESGRLQMERIPFTLEEIFDQLSGIVALRAETQGIELAYDFDDPRQVFSGDPLRLVQVLCNLVGNALKFSNGGNVVVTVRQLSKTSDESELQFSVSDQGIGISPEQLDRLFQPFTQANASTTREYGGTGLGLVISRHLIEMMGGRIWVDSQEGQGSTFHFTARFPVQSESRPGLQALASKLASEAHRPVLVVDDNAIARRILQQQVAQLGLEVHCAASASEALSLVTAAETPNYLACLVDWRMPETDGVATIAQLRAAQVARGLPAASPMILTTSFSHHEELGEIGEQVDGLLAKPVSARHLYVELARCLGVFTDDAVTPPAAAHGLDWKPFQKLDILLVEDVEINQEVILELLGSVGLVARLACNGAEALRMVQAQRPDLVLMDCQMPVMDGYTATRELRAQAATADLPIIALTANALVGAQEECRAAGMNGHVAKPIRMELLHKEMLRCLPTNDVTLAPSSPKASPAAVNPAVLPIFPGIDTTVALLHVGGRLPLLYRVLKLFRDNLGARFACEFATATRHADHPTRIRLAHSLKGVAMTLGAVELGEAAKALLAATETQDEAACASLLPATLAQLESVRAGLAALEDLIAASENKTPH